VTNEEDKTVSVIDTATNTVTATVNVGKQPYGVAVNPIGTKVYVANIVDSTVSVINTTTNTVIATVNVGDHPYGVAVNPTGTKVYVANNGRNTVSVIAVLHQLDQKIIYPHYDFKHLTEKYFEIGMKLRNG